VKNTDSSGVEREHVKTISARWKYTDSVLGLDGGSGSAAGRSVLGVLAAGTRTKNATQNGTNNYKDSNGDTELDPIADLFLLWLWWSDITGG